MSRHLRVAYDDPVASLRGGIVRSFDDSITLILRVRAASPKRLGDPGRSLLDEAAGVDSAVFLRTRDRVRVSVRDIVRCGRCRRRCTQNGNIRKDYRIGTLHYNWPMSAHASQAFSTSTIPIRNI